MAGNARFGYARFAGVLAEGLRCWCLAWHEPEASARKNHVLPRRRFKVWVGRRRFGTLYDTRFRRSLAGWGRSALPSNSNKKRLGCVERLFPHLLRLRANVIVSRSRARVTPT